MTYHIYTEVTLRLGKMPEYTQMMQKLAPYLARHGWKLTQALQPVTGDFRKLIHVWELGEFADVERGLAACAMPDGVAILEPMANIVETESISIMAKTAYI
ncbi:MAG: NIPSNAP family protein [Novosphingobium sp.]|nr:NIPSNAP family protein [Novosphingobium sp.]